MTRPILLAGFILAAALSLCLVPEGPAQYETPYEFDGVVTTSPIAPDGTPIQCDLPKQLHVKNTGGSDGAGLCVNTSLQMCAYWQNEPALWRLQEWSKRRPGGSYPEQVDQDIAAFCGEQGVNRPRYVQIESADLTPLKIACKTGRSVGSTYAFSPSGRYGGARISHMVLILHCDEKWVCVMDNNFPGTYEWMPPAAYQRAYTGGRRTGWCVVFAAPGPPPPPLN